MLPKNKIESDIPPEKRQRGRPPGAQNKTTKLLKEAILQAAEEAGGSGGTVAYLRQQAHENPGPFLALIGKVLPMQVTGEDGGPVIIVTGVPRRGRDA